jgi:hypothetical protein
MEDTVQYCCIAVNEVKKLVKEMAQSVPEWEYEAMDEL